MHWHKTLDIKFGNRHALSPNSLQGVDLYPYSTIVAASVLAPYGMPTPLFVSTYQLKTTLTPTLSAVCDFGFAKLADPNNTTQTIDFSFAPKNTLEALSLFVGMGEQSVAGAPRIWLGQQFIYTPTISQLAFGQTNIYNHSRFVTPKGMSNNVFGKQKLENSQRFITVQGFVATHTHHACDIKNKNATVKAGNLYDSTFGKHNIKLALQFIKPNGVNSSSHGRVWPSHYLRYVAGRGSNFGAVGQHWISYYTRFVSPIGIYGNKYGKDFASSHAIGGTQTIYPDGHIATQWLTRIIPETKNIGVEQGMAGEFGTPVVSNHTQYLSPTGFGHNDNTLHGERFGKLQIYNLRQYISQYFIQNSGLTPKILDPNDPTSISDFGRWTTISNKNRTIGTYSIIGTRFGYQKIYNNARLLIPKAMTGELGTPIIAYRVRHLPISGIEPIHLSYWHIIRNGARVIAPQGIDGLELGCAEFINTRRYLNWIAGFASEQFGTPMIADRVRTLNIEWRYSIAPSTIPLPTIELYTRYISPKGFLRINEWRPNFGRAELIERFNIIKTAGRNAELFGAEVIVYNKTPEYKAFGHDSSEFGTPMVRHQFRRLPADGYQTTIIGKHKIADRTQKITPLGFYAGVIPNLHQIRRLNSPPYSTQYIELNRYNDKGEPLSQGYGIATPRTQVSRAVLHSNNLLADGELMTHFGQATIRTNVIYVPNDLVIKNVGLHHIWVRQQFLSPKAIKSANNYGKPRFSPHTIYAPSGDRATSQAVYNHHNISGYRIQSHHFGRATVSNQHRSIHQRHGIGNGIMSLYGTPMIDLKDKIIIPQGFRDGYIGWHSIPFVLQTINQINHGFIGNIFGTHHINPPADTTQYIKSTGIAGETFGKHDISHFYRHIYPKGALITQMGQLKRDDNPFMWQGLRIGELVFGSYGGSDTSVFGKIWISNKIREVAGVGFDSFVSEPDVINFRGRMTVRRAVDGLPKPSKPVQIITPASIDETMMTVADIKNKVHYIRPDGNSEQFRKGAW